MKTKRFFAIWIILASAVFFFSRGHAWECTDRDVAFTHTPSDYYGSGQYRTDCPPDGPPIRCYHYHRHWICQRDESFYWDRNLDSAAREACGCPLPDGVAPASPAISKEPPNRFHDVPAK